MPITVKPIKKRLCAASVPHPDGEQGWYFCELMSGHGEDHRMGDHTWHDGVVVEVTTVDEIMSVPNHIHSFSGDEDTCHHSGCELRWAMHLRLEDEWRKRRVADMWSEYQQGRTKG